MNFQSARALQIKSSPSMAVSMAAQRNARGRRRRRSTLASASRISTRRRISSRPPIEAMKTGRTRYTGPDGSEELRAAIVAKFKRENGLVLCAGRGRGRQWRQADHLQRLPGDAGAGRRGDHSGALLGLLHRHRGAAWRRRPCRPMRGGERLQADAGKPGGGDHPQDALAAAQLAVEPERRGLFARGICRRSARCCRATRTCSCWPTRSTSTSSPADGPSFPSPRPAPNCATARCW